MTEPRKSVLRSVRLDDDVWDAIKGMECSLNQYLRASLLDDDAAAAEAPRPVHSVGILPPASGAFEDVIPRGHDFRESSSEPVDNRPKNCRCLHCGERFAGLRGSNNCPKCKSSGHTNSPSECPACNEGSAI